jgi:hypothetical protein
MTNALVEYYRCPESVSCFRVQGELAGNAGYFRLGERTIGFGRSAVGSSRPSLHSELPDLSAAITARNGGCFLPFDPDEIVNNLRRERYTAASRQETHVRRLGKKAYYGLRPLLPFVLRKHLKRFALRGWETKAFPSWPVDRTVDETLEQLMLHAMEALGLERVPFIWFWPKGYSSCIVMTHDVENSAGLNVCSSLMDLNDRYGIKSSFQMVPEGRYAVPSQLLQEMRDRGFKINVHDWNHDGFLFSDRDLFLTRATKINEFAKRWGSEGFRSGALYRNQEWYDAFTFDYDMSVPNVGHLDPQAGGCCTVMPYFVGRILEIPLTTIQDYMLFHLLGDYSIDLWKRQLAMILKHNGLASFNVHPDYIIEPRARGVYEELLDHLSFLRTRRNAWVVPPCAVNRWWRSRSQMTLIERNGQWEIDGPGKELACIAYASSHGQHLLYELAQNPDVQYVES